MRRFPLAVLVVAFVAGLWGISGVRELPVVPLADVQPAHAQAGIPVTVSGQIVDALGGPLPNQRVRLSPGAGVSFDAPTDADGRYSLVVSAGSYGVTVDGGFGTQPALRLPQNYSISVNGPLALTQDTVLDFALPLRAVTVNVVDPAGAPLAGVRVTTPGAFSSLIPFGPFTGTGLSSYDPLATTPVVTGPNGTAVLWLFPTAPGATANQQYTLTATPPAGSPFRPGQVTGVAVGGDTTVTMTLAVPVTLSGRIVDALGSALPNQRVRLSPGAGVSFDTTTDADGRYSLAVSPGSYGATVDGGFGTQPALRLPQNYSISINGPLALTQDTVLDFALPLRAVTVRVVDPAGLPVAGTRLTTPGAFNNLIPFGPFTGTGLSSYDPLATTPIVTDDGGAAVLWLFPTAVGATANQQYTVTATPPAGSSFRPGQATGVAVGGDTTVTIALAAPVTLRGRIVDALGSPLPGQRVRLSPGSGVSFDASTDADGRYSLVVSPGSYGATVDGGFGTQPALRLPQSYSISVNGPLALTQDTVLDVALPLRAVTVRVVDPAGAPLAGVRLTTPGAFNAQIPFGSFTGTGLSSYDPLATTPVVTGANGAVVLWLFPTASGATADQQYTLTATPPASSGFVRFNVQGIVVNGETDETIRIGQTVTLAEAPSGTQTVQVRSTGGFTPGSVVTFNAGGPTEETARVVAIGSLVLADPLRFNHGAGEPVVVSPVNCASRTRIPLQVTQSGPGRLRATLTAPAEGALVGNRLVNVRIDRLDNAAIDVEGHATDVAPGTVVTLLGNPTTANLLVRRTTSGPFTAHLTARDLCGPFPTLVGGGRYVQ